MNFEDDEPVQIILEAPEAMDYNKKVMADIVGNEDPDSIEESNNVYRLLHKFESTYDTLIDQVVSAQIQEQKAVLELSKMESKYKLLELECEQLKKKK